MNRLIKKMLKQGLLSYFYLILHFQISPKYYCETN